MANLFIKGIEVPERSYLDNNFFTQTYINDVFLTKNEAKNSYLSKTNTTVYSPSGQYNPATKKYVDDCIAAINQLHFEIVEELPQVGEATIIYMVLAEDGEGEDYYDEYIYINNTWEKIGSTRIDLSPYATIEYVDNIVSEHAPNISAYAWDGDTSSNAALSLFQQVIDDHKAGKTVLLITPNTLNWNNFTSESTIHILRAEDQITGSGNRRSISMVGYARWSWSKNNTYDQLSFSLNSLSIKLNSEDVVTSIDSSGSGQSINIVSANRTYSSPFMPTDPGHPATKKYVDESIDAIDLSPYATVDYVDGKLPIIHYLPYNISIATNPGGGAKYTLSSTDIKNDLSNFITKAYADNTPKFNLVCLINNVPTTFTAVPATSDGTYSYRYPFPLLSTKPTKLGWSGECLIDGVVDTNTWNGSFVSTGKRIALDFYLNLIWEDDIATVTNAGIWVSAPRGRYVGEDFIADYYLNKFNNKVYTPSGNYNPATKKYVDDSINNIDLTAYATKDYVDEGDFVILDLTDYLYGNIWEGGYHRNSLPQNDTSYNFTINDTDNVNKLLKIARDLYDGKTPKAIIKFKYREADNTSTYWTTTAPAHFSRYVDTHDWYLFFTGTNAKPTNALWYHSLFSSFNASITLPNDDTVTSFSLYAAVSSGLPMYKEDVLKRDNTDSYTPTENFNPATKLYVDQNIFNPTLGLSKPIDWPTDFTSVTVDVTAVEDSEGNAVAELDYDSSTGLYSIYNHEPEAFKYYVNKFTFTNNTDSDAVIYFKHRTCLDGFRWLAIGKLDTDLECRSGYGINENDCEYFCNNKENNSVLLTTFVIPANSSHYIIAQIEDMNNERASDYLAEFSIGEMVKQQVATEQYVDDHSAEAPKTYILSHDSWAKSIPVSQFPKLAEITTYYAKYNAVPNVYWYSDAGTYAAVVNMVVSGTGDYRQITCYLDPMPGASNWGTYYGVTYKGQYQGGSFTYYVSAEEYEAQDIQNIYSNSSLTSQDTRLSVNYGNMVFLGLSGTTNIPLGTNNTVSYTPTGDYNPATKKYVDDSISNKIWIGTQAEYDALGTYSDDTLYFIKETQQTSY